MSDQNDSRTAVSETTAVPDLIERYRLRREAWIAQADELARLRDEVRGAAEREALEIVTAARRDVRQVIMEARRELLVLSAQVQAALGEASGKPDPTLLLNRGTSQTPAASAAAGLRSIATETNAELFVPESVVKTMLDEARADMEALAEDAKTVPFQATSLAATSLAATSLAATSLAPPLSAIPFAPTLSAEPPATLLAPDYFESTSQTDEALDHLEEAIDTGNDLEASVASRALLSSPFPIDAVAVPTGRSFSAFVAAFAVIGVVVLGGSYWWLKGRGTSQPVADAGTPSKSADERPAASAPPARAAAPAKAPVVPISGPSAARLSVLVEAREEAWIRTTRDGQSDIGRTYAAGEKVQLNANHDISVRAGNAGAVFVSVNKGIAMPLGRDGQVLTRQFLAETAPVAAAAAPPPAPALPTGPQMARAGVPPASRSPLGTVIAPLPVPLVQPAASSNPPNVPAIDQNSPAVARSEPSLPLPRTEAATAPPVAAPTPVPPSAGPQTTSTSAIVNAARQWLEAYHRQERSAMASLSTGDLQLADERRADERFPANMDVSRTLDKVSVQIAADTAVLTAVMTERGDTGAQRVSPVSQVWVLSGGQWRVRQVRLVSEARLNQIFR